MKLLVTVITVLLDKINVPQNEIREFVDRIDERGVSAMLAIEDYDVQETRREAKYEGKIEGKIEHLVGQIHRKKLKMKTREQIIDELELEPEQVEILDNFDDYRYLI